MAAPLHTNRLSKESSPYLLQHQHNPVDWHAWGPQAFELARKENRPIFLSVGYSTCYWCHVMERESFENSAVAAVMNEHFVCIKVDREERPDVDQLYMTAVQVLSQHGGWPMSVFLTPDLKPFFGGTYFPPEDMPGRMGFVSLLRAVEEAWKHRREQVNASADQLTDILRQLARPPGPAAPLRIDEAFIDELMERSLSDFDARHGGFGSAPKFPRQTQLELMLAYVDGRPDHGLAARAANCLRATLDAMADGGIRDQLGGGFHRYSTDAQWLVPHFEIMLYDNALLAWIYAEAYRQFGRARDADVARGVLEFLLREMTSPDGVFYTAFDAEAEGREGRPYLWTREEVEEVLGGWDSGNRDARWASSPNADVALFLHTYGLDLVPNFADPHHGHGKPDRYVLHRPRPLETVATERGMSVEQLEALLEPMRGKLLEARRKRVQPLLDTKILTSWNALAIRAFAHAGKVLNEARYTQAADRAANWLLQHHLRPHGTLLHASRPDRPGREVDGFLDDYAAMLGALVEMDEQSQTANRKPQIANLADSLLLRFAADPPRGGFYFTDRRADDLIVRQMVASDSPLPSGNALAAMAMLKLGREEPVRQTLTALGESMRRQGEGMSAMVRAALQWVRRFGALEVEQGTNDAPANFIQSSEPVVTLSGRWVASTQLQVELKIREGFHLNPNRTERDLIPTTLSVAEPHGTNVRAVDYPTGNYVGSTLLTVYFNAPPDLRAGPMQVSVHYQACTDSACLAPATARLSIGWA